jgi:protein-disulfide isomerase
VPGFTSEKATVTSVCVLRNCSSSTFVVRPFTAFSCALILSLSTASAAFAQTPEAALDKIPNHDFSSLSPAAKKELFVFLKDEFDLCGRPLTLLASVSKGDACKHTRRMVSWAAAAFQDGLTASEVAARLAKYQQSFSAKRQTFAAPDARMCQGAKESEAKVTVVEFSDFQCPACAAARPALEAAVNARKQLRVCYAPFPLSIHPQAVIAAQAALFARESQKFWPMHDALFQNQQTLSEEKIVQLGTQLGLDAGALKQVFAKKKYVDEIEQFKKVGTQVGLESTPTLYVNGRKLTLPATEAVLKLTTDDEIDWKSNGNAFGND